MNKIDLKITINVVSLDSQGNTLEINKISKLFEIPFVPFIGMNINDGNRNYTIHGIHYNINDWDKKNKKIIFSTGSETISEDCLDEMLSEGWEIEKEQ